MTIQLLDKILEAELKALYSAEKQFADALAQLAEAAEDGLLRQSFESLRKKTERHVERLEGLFDDFAISASDAQCREMQRLIAEGESAVEKAAANGVRDDVLVRTARQLVHYEIASYRCARNFADQLGNPKAARILDRNYDDEDAALRQLDQIHSERAYREALLS